MLKNVISNTSVAMTPIKRTKHQKFATIFSHLNCTTMKM